MVAQSIAPSLIQRMTLSEMMIISHYKNVVSKCWRASQYGLLIAKEVPLIYSASHDIHVEHMHQLLNPDGLWRWHTHASLPAQRLYTVKRAISAPLMSSHTSLPSSLSPEAL